MGWFWNKKIYHHRLRQENDDCFFETIVEGKSGAGRSDWNPLHCNPIEIGKKVMKTMGGQCTEGQATIDNQRVVLGQDCTCYVKKDTPDGFQHISQNYNLCVKAGLFGAHQKQVEDLISGLTF